MDENGIKGREKSHTQPMENQVREQAASTKAKTGAEVSQTAGQVSISAREAVEYQDYKRQKKRSEILLAISRSEGVLTSGEEAGRVCDRAARLQQSAVRLTPARLENGAECFIRRGVAMDCLIGGTGETLTKVKVYEAKTALRRKVKELTLVLSPYQISRCHYTEIRREMKRIRRVARKAKVKLWVENIHPRATVARLARMCGELGYSYLCVPYFEGCEHLKTELSGDCQLQVRGVQTLSEFRRLTEAGVGRIVTEKGWEIYCEWMREVEKIRFPESVGKETREQSGEACAESAEKPVTAKVDLPRLLPGKSDLERSAACEQEPLSPQPLDTDRSETNYYCRLEGTELKFL